MRFFREEFPTLEVHMSLHQILEIFHVLAFRGARMPLAKAREVVERIMASKRILKAPVLAEHVLRAVAESERTGIHIWDFVCFLPVAELVDVVYSCDRHFERIGRDYGVEVINRSRLG